MNTRPSNRGPGTVSNPLKTLLLSATILVSLNMTGAQASVVIDGVAYPDGCRKTLATVRGLTSWHVVCPAGALDERVEDAKRISPPEMPGHSSNGTIPRQPAHQKPIQCDAAINRLNNKLADTKYWFRQAIYRTRVLTTEAATGLRDYIRAYAMRAMSYGESIYAHRRRGEDADGLCREYVDRAYDEVTRLFALVRAEAAAGNRDLEGTGLNPNTSPYNN